MEKYDIVVIGAGPGGYPAAIRSAQQGASVAIIEKEAVGGTCLNWGCIPTKTLIAASSLYWNLQHASRLGLSAEHLACDYTIMLQNKNRVVEKLRGGITMLLKSNGITLIEGTGSFASRNRVAVRHAQGKDTRIESTHTIIATGTATVLPPFLPKSPLIMDSRAFLDLAALPQHLIVLGGGIIGCELACMAAQLGVSVTIIEILEDIMTMLDPDLRGVVRRYMEKQLKIRVLTGQPAESVVTGNSSVKLQVAGQPVEAEAILVATGRCPMTQGLALEKAGVTMDAKGYIPVDSFGQTRTATIYAAGDVTGGPQLAHAATAQGITAAENATGQHHSTSHQLVPSCIFTAPEVGVVGLTEQEAKQKKRAVIVGKFPFLALGRALASDETAGFVKWIVDAGTDQLLGAQVTGAHATELIAEATTAIQAELTARELARTIHAHPTLAEAWMEAAHAVHGECIHAAPKRKKPETKSA